MKKIVYILVVMVVGAWELGAQQLDSAAKAGLGEKIEAYFGALAGESLEVQKAEADFMIELSSDSLIRQFTAQRIYEHYVGSKVMGAENVAIHVFDKWFRDGKLKMDDEIGFMNARIYADFNRRSLIGEKAPELVMESIDGVVDTVGTDGRYSVLFFYDTDCAKCRLETVLLEKLLKSEEFPVRFNSIYVGDDRKEWMQYEEEHFGFDTGIINSCSYWDPEIRSDYQRKYGILQTPRMFLVNPEGIIIGRGLDTRALSVMLHGIFDVPELEYGSEESAKLFDGIFEGVNNVDDVRRIADYIEESTEGNDVMFRQLTGDMLYWLSGRSGEAFKEGTDYLIDNKILSRPEVWKTADDSLKVIGLAQFMDGLLDKAVPGTKIADFKVPGDLLKGGRRMSLEGKMAGSGKFRLDRIGGRRNVIIFYTEGCGNCAAEKEAARRLAVDDRGLRVLMINVDHILEESPESAGRLFEAFDLSSLPFVIETDRKGIIQRRYISLVQ